MGQQINVSDEIDFRGDAANDRNVRGNMNLRRAAFVEHFVGKALDTTNDVTTFIDTTSTVALAQAATATGIVDLTTAATGSKTASIAGNLVLWSALNARVEWRFKIDDISNVRINVGMNDETAEGTGDLPFAISGTTVTPVCTDGVHFVFDTDQNTDRFYAVSRKGGGASQAQILASGRAPVNATYVILAIQLNSEGDAFFYYNGRIVHKIESAVTVATALCPYIGIRNANASAHILSADYFKLWGD